MLVAHGRELGRPAAVRLVRRRRRPSEAGADRHAVRRDDRALVLRLRDRDGDVRLRDLEVPGEARRRVRRRADPRQHQARDRLDRDPDGHRPLRRRLQLDRPRRHRGARPPTGCRSTSPRSSSSGPSSTREADGRDELERAARARSTASSSSTLDGARRPALVLGARSGGSSATWCRPGAGGDEIDNTVRGHPERGGHLQRWSAPSSAGSGTRRCGRPSWSSPRRSSTPGSPSRQRREAGGRRAAGAGAGEPIGLSGGRTNVAAALKKPGLTRAGLGFADRRRRSASASSSPCARSPASRSSRPSRPATRT